MQELKAGKITSPLGFKTNALCCGMKLKKPDLALIYSIVNAKAAAVFTSNRVKAAHIEVDKQKLRNNCAQAVVINSGNANCCTGSRGKQDALRITAVLSEYLKLPEDDVLIASTGVIGKYLPVKKILDKLTELANGLNFDKADEAASAIMTTDTYAKQTAAKIKIRGKEIIIGAIAKGAGMICPEMATMLCFITTDANIKSSALKRALKEAVNDSFNCISVDGEMSTNDSVIILANGLANNVLLTEKSKELKVFTAALKYVCLKLAKMIVEDGEGATKLIQVNVIGAGTRKQAEFAARYIANSLLIKTMIAGENPNWGRIPARLGASRIPFDPAKLIISLQKKIVYRNGCPVLKDNSVLVNLLSKKHVEIGVNLNNGEFNYTMWASDLTKEYVRINTEYN